MFTKYFREKTKKIWKDYNSFKKSLSKEKEVEEKQEKKKKKKVILPKDILINFLEEHLPERYKVAENGTIIDSKSAEVNGDIIIYHHYCPIVRLPVKAKTQYQYPRHLQRHHLSPVYLYMKIVASPLNCCLYCLDVICKNCTIHQNIFGRLYRNLQNMQ